MKILVCIPNYENLQIKYLEQVIYEYSKFKYDVDVVLFNTISTKHIFSNVNELIYSKSVGKYLAAKHIGYFINNVNKYDYYIYSDDDVLITQNNFDTYLKHTKILNDDKIVYGFVRYEIKNELKYLNDLMPNRDNRNPEILYWNDCNYFEPSNPHQSCYIISNSQLLTLKNNPLYANENKDKYGMILEHSATDIWWRCRYIKRISCLDLENSLVHHLSNKYVDIWKLPELEEFKTLLKRPFQSNEFNLKGCWVN